MPHRDFPLSSLVQIGCVFAGFAVAGSGPTFAAIPDLTWGPAQLLDTGVSQVGGSGGPAAVFDPVGDGLWYVCYERSADVFVAAGGAAGWSSPIPVSDDPAASRKASIASSGGLLHVVWEDERSGHSEIWTRRFDGTSWTSAECLSCDPLPSRSPALDGDGEGYAYLVWEEEGSVGETTIAGRMFDDAAWGAATGISESSTTATEPAVCAIDPNGVFRDPVLVVAWTDGRHGETEIYARIAIEDFWQPEERVTDLAGTCARPRVHAQICCFDIPGPTPLVVFENDRSGVIESWGAAGDGFTGEWYPPFPTSMEDGYESRSPSVAGIKFDPDSCYEFDRAYYHVTWTDTTPDGTSQQFARFIDGGSVDAEDDPIPVPAGTIGAVAARTMSPESPLLQCWVGDDGNLSARVGADFNCRVDVLEAETLYFVIAPHGAPNVVSLRESCADTPIAGAELMARFYNGLETKIAIDPFEELPLEEVTDDDGRATFSLRGGGCVTEEAAGNGFLLVGCPLFFFLGGPVTAYDRIKSPDIDGTCSVDAWDLEYVQERVGTDDFCADLDGSGLVDEIDVGLVLATLGDECERTAEAPDGGPSGETDASRGTLRVTPNPGSDRFHIVLELAAAGDAAVQIVDVSGRLVRRLGVVPRAGARSDERASGSMHTVVWDGRDEQGRSVPSGIYYADVRGAGTTGPLRSAIIVTR